MEHKMINETWHLAVVGEIVGWEWRSKGNVGDWKEDLAAI